MMKYRMITRILASTLSIMLIVLAAPLAVTAVSSEKPRLNYYKKTLCIKKTYNLNRSFKLRVKKTKSKARFKTSNKKVAIVTKSGKVIAKKPGKTTITAKIDGYSLKCKVTVKSVSKFAKLLRNKTIKIRYKIKKNRTLNINVGQLSKFKNYEDLTKAATYFEESDNIYRMYLKGKFTNKQKNKYMTAVEKYVKYTSNNPQIAKVTKHGAIIPKKAGSATISVRLINKSFKIKVNVTRKSILTYKGHKSLAVYSDRDVYNALKDAFYNHLIKGEKPEYKYLTCFYKVKSGNWLKKDTLQHKLINYALAEKNSGNNFFVYLTRGFFTSEFYYIKPSDNSDIAENLDNSVITVGLEADILQYVNLTYKEATEIFRDSGIDECTSDYDKLKAMHLWFYDNTTYGGTYSDVEEYSALVDRVGICTTYSFATLYLCTLLRIPCDYVISDTHMWNVCQVQGKWYYFDALHYVVLLGDSDMPYDVLYQPREIANLDGRIHIENKCFVFPEDIEPTETNSESGIEPS